jgi:hypothetical protein
MSKIDGFYVDMTGKVLEVVAIHTTNPRIVDLSDHNLGLVVVDQQFFESEEDAREQAKYNAEDTIAACEELLESLEKPKKKVTVPQGDSKRGFLGRKTASKDPLGPPKYGVGLFLMHKRLGTEYEITGFKTDSDGVIYIIKGGENGKSELRINRAALDRQFEVVE